MHPALQALLICGAAAAVEGALAGRGVRARFAELRQPPLSPSLTLWVLIGVAYYIICFILLYRLLATSLSTALRDAALLLLLVLMAVNAGWGWLFFRRKDLRASYLAFLPYALIALALTVLLTRIDSTAALVLTPYLLYLGYAVWWFHRLWVLNRTPSASGLTRA